MQRVGIIMDGVGFSLALPLIGIAMESARIKLDGRVKMALDYFDASINRIAAWVVGFRNVQKALLPALLTPNYSGLQNADNWTELMVCQEEFKTMPFGEVWNQYCRECGVPIDGEWFEQVKQYEVTVLKNR